jgi:spermidine/putrescine-binding protein
MRRRDFLATAAAAAAAAPFAKIGSASAQAKPDQIVVMTWGGRHGDVMAKGIDKAFTEATGIKVVQDRSADPPQRITKLKLGLNNQMVDIVQLPDTLAPLGVRQGVLEPIDPKAPQLTNLKDVYPNLLLSHWVAMIYSPIGMVYNTKEIKNPPTSWADMWRPEFKGRIVLPEISNSVGNYIISIGAMAAGKSPKDADAGFEMLKRIVDLQPIWQKETDSMVQSMANGEGLITYLPKTHGYTAQDRGGSVLWAFPKEGAITYGSGTAIAKNTKNLDAALQYLNFTLDPKLQTYYTQIANYPGSNSKMIDFLLPNLQERVRFTKDELANMIGLDQEFMSDVRAEWTDRWNRIVAGG